MSVKQQSGAGHEAGRHGGGVAGIELNQDETVPGGAIAVDFGLELAEEGFPEFERAEDAVGGNQGTGGGGGRIGEQNVFEIVGAGEKDGGALVDFGGIEQVEDGKMLNGKDFVHTVEAEAALAVEEVGDMSLFESGLLSKMEAGEFPCCDAFQEDFTEVILQELELHWGEYSIGFRLPASGCRLPAAGFRLSALGFRLPAAGCRLPASEKSKNWSGVEGEAFFEFIFHH